MSCCDLVELLEATDPLSPGVCFVLLWTYYGQTGNLREAENELSRAAKIPPRLEPLKLDGPLAESARKLAGRLRTLVHEPPEFHAHALRFLLGLDRRLDELQPSLLAQPFVGCDGEQYLLRPRGNFIADTLRDHGRALGTAQDSQSLSVWAYAPRMVVLPARTNDYEIRVHPIPGGIARRLQSERDRLTVLLWPLQPDPEFPDLAKEPLPNPIALFDPANETALLAHLEQGLEAAREQRATLLLFPELVFTPAMLERCRTTLGSMTDSHPLLTIAGLCHARAQGASAHLNEAVVLGPNGGELLRHRKLSSFTHSSGVGEGILLGDTVSVLETPIGNLCPLICLDLFHSAAEPAIGRTHANLLVVPSLSERCTTHAASAIRFANRLRASTFVANQPLPRNPKPGAESLWRLPLRGQEAAKQAPGRSLPLVFRLDDILNNTSTTT